MQNGWIILPLLCAIMFFITGIMISILFFPSSISSDALTRDIAFIGGEYLVDALGGEGHTFEVNDIENNRFRFDVDYRDEMHPSIRPLEHRYAASTALSAKFRSFLPISLYSN